ncbi:glutamate receptor 1-like [Ornithodoros turicata]|uniref:glutamate receptor 1-like n=1 Tax=Ornithodoros turicata TaxID=34597 RepID=UPI00313977E9
MGRLLQSVVCWTVIVIFGFVHRGCTVKIGVIVKPDLNIVQAAYEGVMYNYSNSNVAQEIQFKVKTNFATLEDTDLFSTSRTLCEQLRSNVTTVILSSTVHSSLALQSLFKNTNVPYVATSYQEHCSINVGGNLNLPSADSLGVSLLPDYLPAVAEVIDHFKWESFVYIYDSDNGPSKLQRLLSHQYKNPVTMRFAKHISNSSEANQFLRQLEDADRESRKYVVLDSVFDTSKAIIVDHVRDIYMGRRNYHFLLVNPVVNELSYQKIPEFAAVNITGFRMISEDLSQQSSYVPAHEPKEKKITVEEALIHDAASLIVNTYKDLKLRSLVPHRYSYIFEDHEETEHVAPGSLVMAHGESPEAEMVDEGDQVLADAPDTRTSCGGQPSVPQELGEIITRNLRERSFQGLTGFIRFTSDGCRIDYGIHVVQLNTKNEAVKIGEWSDTKGFEAVTAPAPKVENETEALDKNKVYIVRSVLDKPYMMLEESQELTERTGNDRFDGYCKDLMDLIAKDLDIKYELKAAEETDYGRRDHKVQGGWTGLVGEVLRKEVDMGLGGTLVTSERLEAVDFTVPFMTTGTAALMRKPRPRSGDGMFTFLRPFSFVLWIFVASSVAIVFVIMFFLSFFTTRVSPSKPGVEPSAAGSLYKSLCYSLEAFTPHYLDSYYARSISGRLVGNIWWLFIVFVFSAYTASLVPYLYSETRLRDLRTLDDLARQLDLEYGFVKQSPARQYFENSSLNSTVHKKMWEFMNSKPDVFVNSYEEGVERVRKSEGKYVFLTDANKVDYISSQKPCDTTRLGDVAGVRSLAIALPKGSFLRKHLDGAITRLAEQGELDKLKKKWWVEKSSCKENGKRAKPTAMPLENFIGVFFILGGGVGLGILVALIETIYKACTRSSAAKAGVPETASTGSVPVPEKEFAEQVLVSA